MHCILGLTPILLWYIAWWATVNGISKSQIWLSNFSHSLNNFIYWWTDCSCILLWTQLALAALAQYTNRQGVPVRAQAGTTGVASRSVFTITAQGLLLHHCSELSPRDIMTSESARGSGIFPVSDSGGSDWLLQSTSFEVYSSLVTKWQQPEVL